MSYCRWSSDNWMCDVYVYEAEIGFTIHVAGSKYVDEIPKVPPMPHEGTDEQWDEWFKLYNAQMEAVKKSAKNMKKIGGIYDGQTFICDDQKATIEKLRDIKEHGYNVPEFVFESLQEEIDETSKLES